MNVGNISSALQKIKLGTVSGGSQLGQRPIEIMDLLLKTGAVRAIGEKTLAVNNREQRIEEAPLRFAIRLQVGVAEFQFFAEGGALLARGEPFVVFLAEIRIAGGTFDATGFFRRVWTRLRIASSIPGFAPRRADESGRA